MHSRTILACLIILVNGLWYDLWLPLSYHVSCRKFGLARVDSPADIPHRQWHARLVNYRNTKFHVCKCFQKLLFSYRSSFYNGAHERTRTSKIQNLGLPCIPIPSHGHCLVSPRRFERLTYSLGGSHSIQLSYGDRVYSNGKLPVMALITESRSGPTATAV